MIRVFLVDDHEIVRCGVADLIDDEHDLVVVGQASSASEAMRRIPAVNPDIAVLDVRLPDGNGIELCRDLRSRCPDLNCLMLTSFTDEQAMLAYSPCQATSILIAREYRSACGRIPWAPVDC
ncbi:response regulator, partial [Mycobacteroides abscessus]|uniref:response regulator n=1 Tax=Mycobacteroides abscessus TaxID=36809 RepID=UPI001F1CEB83